MGAESKSVNFGDIDHFLYVRMMSVCADLGFTTKEMIEQGYCLLVDLITEKGETQFFVLQDEYKKYADYRAHSHYSPRMIDKIHPCVISGIAESIHDHLVVIRKENDLPWIAILRILLMCIEANMDKIDAELWKDLERKEAIIEEFRSKRTARLAALSNKPEVEVSTEDSYQIDKTKKRRAEEREVNKYPERTGFRILD